jgi:hypothetical protein
MNLTPGSVYSWEELCAWFTANFASAYQQHGVEAHLHVVRQEPGETLWLSSLASPRYAGPYLASPMPLSLLLSDRGCVMRRCWRSWRHMTWKPSPRSSFWLTNVPELLRAVHGTRHHRLESTKWVARVPSPRATAKRRRRTAATRGRSLLLRSL